MRIVSTALERTVSCRCGSVIGYVPADVYRTQRAVAPSAVAAEGVTVLTEWRPIRCVTCPCCWARVEVEP